MYTTAQLIELFNNNKCPKYIYVGSSAKDNKIGFIFSDKQISNAKTIFENAGYKVSFEQNGGQDLDDLNIKNFEKQISEMKEKIQEYEDNNWGNVYDEKCSGLTYFGGMHIGENLILQEYDKLKLNLPSDYKISDEYKSVYNKYKNIKCAEKKNEINIKDENYDMDLSGCIIDAGTQEIIDWIMNIIRVGGILLLIVLGMLDFIKAAASGEQEEMKKSKSKFIKRLIACVGLFLIPLVVDILLGLINLAGGANGDCSSKTAIEIKEESEA